VHLSATKIISLEKLLRAFIRLGRDLSTYFSSLWAQTITEISGRCCFAMVFTGNQVVMN